MLSSRVKVHSWPSRCRVPFSRCCNPRRFTGVLPGGEANAREPTPDAERARHHQLMASAEHHLLAALDAGNL